MLCHDTLISHSHPASFKRDSCLAQSASLLFAAEHMSDSFVSLAASAALVDVPDACEDSRADCRDFTSMLHGVKQRKKRRRKGRAGQDRIG